MSQNQFSVFINDCISMNPLIILWQQYFQTYKYLIAPATKAPPYALAFQEKQTFPDVKDATSHDR